MTAPRHPLERDDALELPDYNLKIMPSGQPAHSYRCRRCWAQRDRVRQADYDPADHVRNACLDVLCDCGVDGRYARYLTDQLIESRMRSDAQAKALERVRALRNQLSQDTGIHRTAAVDAINASLWTLNIRCSAFAEVTDETCRRLTTALGNQS